MLDEVALDPKRPSERNDKKQKGKGKSRKAEEETNSLAPHRSATFATEG